MCVLKTCGTAIPDAQQWGGKGSAPVPGTVCGAREGSETSY